MRHLSGQQLQLCFATACGFVFSGCTGTPSPTADAGRRSAPTRSSVLVVAGVVTDADGRAVNGAVVRIVALAHQPYATQQTGACTGDPLNNQPVMTTDLRGTFVAKLEVGAPPFLACVSVEATPPPASALRSSVVSTGDVSFRSSDGRIDTATIRLTLPRQ